MRKRELEKLLYQAVADALGVPADKHKGLSAAERQRLLARAAAPVAA
jgi:hypothetical protein